MDKFTLYELICLQRLVADNVGYYSFKLDDSKAKRDEIGEKFYRQEFNFYCELLDKFNKLLDMEV